MRLLMVLMCVLCAMACGDDGDEGVAGDTTPSRVWESELDEDGCPTTPHPWGYREMVDVYVVPSTDGRGAFLTCAQECYQAFPCEELHKQNPERWTGVCYDGSSRVALYSDETDRPGLLRMCEDLYIRERTKDSEVPQQPEI